jgi:thiamine phosphate synthase YjbQ (UPF0047 family)
LSRDKKSPAVQQGFFTFPSVKEDILMILNQVVPWKVENGQLVLGTWQGIFFCEFDGPRNRKVHVRFLK